jgi:hypothetical protein
MSQVPFSEIVVLWAPLIERGKASAKDRMMSDFKNRFVFLGISVSRSLKNIFQPL